MFVLWVVLIWLSRDGILGFGKESPVEIARRGRHQPRWTSVAKMLIQQGLPDGGGVHSEAMAELHRVSTDKVDLGSMWRGRAGPVCHCGCIGLLYLILGADPVSERRGDCDDLNLSAIDFFRIDGYEGVGGQETFSRRVARCCLDRRGMPQRCANGITSITRCQLTAPVHGCLRYAGGLISKTKAFLV